MTNQKKATKVEAVYNWILERIQWQHYTAGQRIPSVRALAKQLDVSVFTVVQAYDRLAGLGHIYAVAGAGYYVSTRSNVASQSNDSNNFRGITDNILETGWMMNHLFKSHPENQSSGSGQLPIAWWQHEQLQAATKRVIPELHHFIYRYGNIQGYESLRKLFAWQLDDMGIRANPQHMVTTLGVSGAIELVSRYLLHPGDSVLVDDPGWYWIIGCLQRQGVKILGIKRNPDGPDIEQLQTLLQQENPKLYITNSVLHNPTSFNLHPSVAHKVLNLLKAHNIYILEDDVYSHFVSGTNAIRYATLDSEQVFYVNGPSKIIGGNWRVGVLCCPSTQIEGVIHEKMLSNMSTPEISERAIYQLLSDSYFRKHVSHIQDKLQHAHETLRPKIRDMGLSFSNQAQRGLLLWVNTHQDTMQLAMDGDKARWLIAPGHLFSPQYEPSTYLRLNVAMTSDEFLQWLDRYLQK